MKKLLLSILSLVLFVPWMNAQIDCATVDDGNLVNNNLNAFGIDDIYCRPIIYSTFYRQSKYRSKYQVQNKEVRVNLIILQKDDSTGNFQKGDSLHEQYLTDVENSVNSRLSNLMSPPASCSTSIATCYSPNYIADVGIQFKFNRIYLQDSYYADYNANGLDSLFNPDGTFYKLTQYCPGTQGGWYLDPLDSQINSMLSDSLGINVYLTQAQTSLNRLDSCLDSHPWYPVACSESASLFTTGRSARVHLPDKFSRYEWQTKCYPYNPLWNTNNRTAAQLYADLVFSTSGGLLHELLHQFFISTNHCNHCNDAMNSPSSGSRQYLSEKNIKAVHKALAITNMRQLVVNVSPPNGLASNDSTKYDFIEIDQNEVIDFHLSVYQDIVIRSGNTLTVQCKLYMPKNGKIIIEPGAQLIVDEGVITTIDGNYWYGIYIEGSSGPQTTTNQGKLVLKNGALLDNVQYAINFGKEGQWNDFGGIVEAEEATLRVSRRAAAFMTYPHTNNSFFKRCTLEYVPGLTEVPLSLVTLWDNHGVNFEGCTFKDETNLNQYHKNVANGIYSIDATYQVLAYCNYPPNTVPTSPCPASFVVPSSFTNFNQGVYATGAAGMRTVTVDQTDFIDNSMGAVSYTHLTLPTIYSV